MEVHSIYWFVVITSEADPVSVFSPSNLEGED
jgi:hypothetical protein